MGFFKKLFKRKKGGTFFGNLLRSQSSKYTGGLLGSGSGLAKWEAREAKKEYTQQMLADTQKSIYNSKGAQASRELDKLTDTSLAGKTVPQVDGTTVTYDENGKPLPKWKAWAKKFWWVIAIVTAVIIGGIIYLVRGKKGNSKAWKPKN